MAVGTEIKNARPPVCFGPEKVEQADKENGSRRKLFWMRNAEILKAGERADSSGH